MQHFLYTLCLSLFSSFLIGQSHFYIANRDGDNILKYTTEGVFVEAFVSTGLGGLDSPQDILFHPEEDWMIVTGFNNTNIKKYDSNTGAYLGNFSSGYNLARPTKMLLGQDNMIYVTQWGSTQNKIVRFDLDGAFVDEWSKIGVPEGCGMTWDNEGNMYVTTWSNGLDNGTAGFVRKLSQDGEDLGIFINSSVLQGPVGLWIDENDDYLVVDWTRGAVLRFGSNGVFKSNFITGMNRTEGNDVGPDGKYYLCDWQLNRINRYNQDGSFDGTIASGSPLNIPNSLKFEPEATTTSNKSIDQNFVRVEISPNPSALSAELNYYLDKATSQLNIKVMDTSKKTVKTLFNGSQVAGSHKVQIDLNPWPAGVYYVVFQNDTQLHTQSLIVVK